MKDDLIHSFIYPTPKIVSWCTRHGLNPTISEGASTWQDFFEKLLDILDELEKKE